ncbi:hypothetical protein I552_3613 [Mycobacterium xenopi 3993]|nr:hypothetical protein I552_3613 [Mycobacterium xenopi 3993]
MVLSTAPRRRKADRAEAIDKPQRRVHLYTNGGQARHIA